MAKIHDLLEKITDPGLKEALAAEVAKLSKQKKFGLVFEEHLPEACPMPGVKIRVGMSVATRAQDGGALFKVKAIKGEKAICVDERAELEAELPLEDLVAVTKFGEPIYPYLEKIDELEHGGGDLWHTLIQADNYHALQLLEYLYPGQVDCIYIDPPYNTGAKDWKYNNDYVDGNDAWRHSKWLSMMEKRLKIAKRLLNPRDSVLIVTIDEKEYLHLGMLLEQMFPEARMQMISTCINPGGVSQGVFRRVDEYYFFVMLGSAQPSTLPLGPEWFGGELSKHVKDLNWRSFSRSGSNSAHKDRPNLFYPIFVNVAKGVVSSVGETFLGVDRSEVIAPEGCCAVWPLHSDGSEAYWMYTQSGLKALLRQGYFKVGGRTKNGGFALYYLNKGEQEKINSGVFEIIGRDNKDGSIITKTNCEVQSAIAPSQWRIPSHNARTGGTEILKKIIPSHEFTFPKSLYAVHDAIRFFVANKPNALILDFFAGSGTTLHAVNLLNAEDGGKRRCILVTNNEVSNDEAAAFRKDGIKLGDEAWEAKGIARYVTWPRTTCSIKGVNVKGEPLKGDYLGPGVTDEGALPGMERSEKRPLKMSEGFKANAAFFKLGFTHREIVENGLAFSELLSMLWLKSGAVGKCPEIAAEECPEMLVLPENGFAVLLDTAAFVDFRKAVIKDKRIKDIYLVEGDEEAYAEMASRFRDKNTCRLFGDYVNHFVISARRNG